MNKACDKFFRGGKIQPPTYLSLEIMNIRDDGENEGPWQVYFYPRDRRRLTWDSLVSVETQVSVSSAVNVIRGGIAQETRAKSKETRATISGHRRYTLAASLGQF